MPILQHLITMAMYFQRHMLNSFFRNDIKSCTNKDFRSSLLTIVIRDRQFYLPNDHAEAMAINYLLESITQYFQI